MSILDDIIRVEREFQRDFADVAERPYGVLFYIREIPDSYDGNHAQFLRAEGVGLTEAVADVTAFYRGLGIPPRVYHLVRPGEGRPLRGALADAGYSFSDEDTRFFVRCGSSQITPLPAVQVERVTSLSPDLALMVERSGSMRARRILERRVRSAAYHLLVASVHGRPVAVASLQEMGGLSRVDDVRTDVGERGKGYGRALIHHLVRYHSEVMAGTLYLYADNPTAIRIYLEAGFVEMEPGPAFWSAWLE